MRLTPLVAFFIVAACSSQPVDPEASTSSAQRHCPRTDPDYPECGGGGGGGSGGGGGGGGGDTCQGMQATLSASSPSLTPGQSTTLFWSFTSPPGCEGELTLDSVPVGLTGTKVIAPLSTTPYHLRLGPKIIATVTVVVNLPRTVRIDGNTGEWRRLFVEAIGTPRTRVVLTQNVDLDMTGFEFVRIASGVTVTSEAPPPVLVASVAPGIDVGTIGQLERPPQRNAQDLGPRIYVTDRPRPLFILDCKENGEGCADNVRFIGFRLQGPHYDTMEGDANLERAIQVVSCNNVEIADMEISGWSGQGVYVEDPKVRQEAPEAVRVHDNFFHNNQHKGGDGYGVETGPGGHALIERNSFDLNRHAIASSGAPRTTYVALQNLVLKGGGHHDKWYEEYTHLFDVHGDDSCTLGFDDHVFNCGNAGDRYTMVGNAFQYTHGTAVKLRGTPRNNDPKTLITGNVFPSIFERTAVELYVLYPTDPSLPTPKAKNVDLGPNTLGVDTYGEYGVCDFDGDGKDDLFLATGVSWWYRSAAKMHWVYLAPYTERLSQVGLGDFDGDRRCDVFAINHGTNNWEIARGGSGAWTALPGNYPGIPMEQLRFGDFNGDKVMDIFRRAPDGEWSAISPGRYPWTHLQSSSYPIEALRLGDFDGNGITDVLSRSGVSWDGTSPWRNRSLNITDDLRTFYVGDVDGKPGDDLVRYVKTSPVAGRWEVSSGADTAWTAFASYSWPDTPGNNTQAVAGGAHTFLGHFTGTNPADLLMIEDGELERAGRIARVGGAGFVQQSLYPY